MQTRDTDMRAYRRARTRVSRSTQGSQFLPIRTAPASSQDGQPQRFHMNCQQKKKHTLIIHRPNGALPGLSTPLPSPLGRTPVSGVGHVGYPRALKRLVMPCFMPDPPLPSLISRTMRLIGTHEDEEEELKGHDDCVVCRCVNFSFCA